MFFILIIYIFFLYNTAGENYVETSGTIKHNPLARSFWFYKKKTYKNVVNSALLTSFAYRGNLHKEFYAFCSQTQFLLFFITSSILFPYIPLPPISPLNHARNYTSFVISLSFFTAVTKAENCLTRSFFNKNVYGLKMLKILKRSEIIKILPNFENQDTFGSL